MATANVQTLVCDFCGKPAEEVITFRVEGGNVALDVCADDLRDLRKRGHKPRRGRRPNSLKAARTTKAA